MLIHNDKTFFKICEISLAVYKLKFSRHFVKYSQICIKQLTMGNGRVTAKYELWLFAYGSFRLCLEVIHLRPICQFMYILNSIL